MKLKGISNKKVRKRDEKQKNNKNGIISLQYKQKQKINKNGIISLQYKHNFKIRFKNTLNNKTQESWISHAWLAIHGPCMANYTLVYLLIELRHRFILSKICRKSVAEELHNNHIFIEYYINIRNYFTVLYGRFRFIKQTFHG